MLADGERGLLPFAGGMLDQPVSFVSGLRMLRSAGWLKYVERMEAKDGR